MNDDVLLRAYNIGKRVADEEMSKVAFLGAITSGAKFLTGMGHLGAKGSTLAKLTSPHNVGVPLSFGVLGAVTADEGHKTEGFLKGLAGGVAWNVASPFGSTLGRRLLAPAFKGNNTMGVMRGIGFDNRASQLMSTSQRLNKPWHGAVERRLSRGVAGKSEIAKVKQVFSGLDDLPMSPELAAQKKKIEQLLNMGSLGPQQQVELHKLYSQFTSSLYQQGFKSGTGGQRAMLKGLRFSKGLGGAVGGMAAGMGAGHMVEGALDAAPASAFDATGGH